MKSSISRALGTIRLVDSILLRLSMGVSTLTTLSDFLNRLIQSTLALSRSSVGESRRRSGSIERWQGSHLRICLSDSLIIEFGSSLSGCLSGGVTDSI